jgi:hypothetical protein
VKTIDSDGVSMLAFSFQDCRVVETPQWVWKDNFDNLAKPKQKVLWKDNLRSALKNATGEWME